MKCLSIRQPMAEAILRGAKVREYRTWSTPYRGPLLIHAGKTPPPAELVERWGIDADELVLGAVVGLVDVVDVEEEPCGCFAWVLSHPRRLLRPLPLIGRLRLWHVPAELLAGLLPDTIPEAP